MQTTAEQGSNWAPDPICGTHSCSQALRLAACPPPAQHMRTAVKPAQDEPCCFSTYGPCCDCQCVIAMQALAVNVHAGNVHAEHVDLGNVDVRNVHVGNVRVEIILGLCCVCRPTTRLCWVRCLPSATVAMRSLVQVLACSLPFRALPKPQARPLYWGQACQVRTPGFSTCGSTWSQRAAFLTCVRPHKHAAFLTCVRPHKRAAFLTCVRPHKRAAFLTCVRPHKHADRCCLTCSCKFTH